MILVSSYTMAHLQRALLTSPVAAQLLGLADQLIRMTIDYVKVRRQFNVVIGSQQEEDLKRQQEVISKEYGLNAMVVESGRISRVGGFDIIVSERLATSAANTLRNCIAFVRSGLYLGLWKDMTVNITNRQDLSSQPWQLYSMVSAGATRTQLGKIIQVNAADTTGVDPTAP